MVLDLDNTVIELIDKNRKTILNFSILDSISLNYDRFLCSALLNIKTKDDKKYEVSIMGAKDFENKIKHFVPLHIKINGFHSRYSSP